MIRQVRVLTGPNTHRSNAGRRCACHILIRSVADHDHITWQNSQLL
jgi:hypothetical protein